MKIMNKAVSLIILVAVLVPLINLNVIAEDGNNAAQPDNLSILKKLEIIDSDFAFSKDEYVTRGELAYVAAKLSGYEEPVASGNIFPDVKAEDKYAGEIEALAISGIVSGKDDGTFASEQSIRTDEAVKILVSILGYTKRAEYYGGYPEGYMQAAAGINLFYGADSTSTLLTQESLEAIAVNSFEVEIPTFKGIVGDDVEYSVQKDKTLLSEYHNILADDGIISGNYFTCFEGRTVGEDSVYIDNFGEVLASGTNADEYLGYEVTYYIKDFDDKDSCRLLHFDVTKQNTVQVINAGDLAKDEIALSHIAYYDENERVKKAKLSDDVKIVYNGVHERNVSLDMLKPISGQITLIDADSDNKADTVMVENAVIAIADNVDVENFKLYTKHSDEVYNLDPGVKKVRIRNHNEEIDFKYINKNDVLAITKSLDESVLTITVSNKRISGAVVSVDEDKAYIGEEEYKISSSYFILSARNDIYVPDIKVGLEGTFYIDPYGELAYVTESGSDEWKYGFLLWMGKDETSDMSVRMKLFTEDKKLLTYDTSEKFWLNIAGERERAEDADAIMNSLCPGGVTQRQLVKIKLDAEGLIKEIETAAKADVKKGYDTENFSLDYGITSIQHRFGALGTRYRVGGTTIVFTVPNDMSDYDNYSIVDAGSLLESFVYEKTAIYDADENKIAGVVVLYDMQGGGGLDVALYQTKLSIVDSVSKDIDANGDVTYRIYYYTDGVRKSNLVKSEDVENIYSRYWRYDGITADKLNKGDIIQLRINSEGLIETYHVLYKGETTYAEYSSSGAPTADWYTGAVHTAFGVVKDKVSKRITVNAHGKGTDDAWLREFLVDSVPVFVWDEDEKPTCRIGTMYDISLGDEVFVKTVNNAVREVVVFK